MIKKYLWTILLLFAVPCYALNPFQAFMMSAGASGAAAPACNPASNEVGDRTDYGTEHIDFSADTLYCFLYTADCSGTLGYAYIYHYGTATDNAKVCVYSDDGDGNADAGDTKIACSDAITASADQQYQSSGKLGGSVIKDTNYWVCVIPDSTGFDVTRTASGYRTLNWGVETGSYATPPNNLTNATSDTASRDFSVYVGIE
jgi:hypothetical protein